MRDSSGGRFPLSVPRLIAPTLGRKLYERAKDPKRFVLVEGGSHHNTNAVGQAQYREAVADLFGLQSNQQGGQLVRADGTPASTN